MKLKALISNTLFMNGGKIPFSLFMDLALYTPGLGYYTNGTPKFGPNGDFITAPELSPHLFGKCVLPVIQDFSHILEFGAGSGVLAKSLLDLNPHIEKYWIFDISEELRERQKQTLKDHLHKITWLTELPKTPFAGAIIANEIIDAFPATRFLWKDNEVYEYFVTEKHGEYHWEIDTPTDTTITEFVKNLNLPDNFTSEMHLALRPWIKNLSEILASGIILIIDYGNSRADLYHPQRHEGMLTAHYKHVAHYNALEKPGEQDLTAHVDFTTVAEAAVENGLHVAGYTSQAAFLLDNHLLEHSRGEIDVTAIERLTSPVDMGEYFKVMALTKNWDKDVPGFSMQDRRHSL